MKPTYTIVCEPEDIPVRGNALVSGDDAEDKAQEDSIIADLRKGNQWAWCFVHVYAEFRGFKGDAGLGCCSYADQADFERCEGEQMRAEALADLKQVLKQAVVAGNVAKEALEALDEE
jgi:hypothetical protein